MEKLLKIVLSPVTLLYAMVIWIRNKLFDWKLLKSEEFDIPVICVGNISVGGTGKTPHTEYLIELLKDKYRVAVLSKGYKRQSKGFQLADDKPEPANIGDEPCQMKLKFPEIIVAVDNKRTRGIKLLEQLPDPPDVILLDDGFQHRYVKAGMNILLMDFSKPAKKDMLMPSGRLREPLSSKKRANIILITKTPERLKAIEMRIIAREMHLHEFQHLFFTGIYAESLKPVFSKTGIQAFEQNLIQSNIILVSGIADPRKVKPFVRKYSSKITEVSFPDHHNYSIKDINHILNEYEKLDEDGIIITTEKDAVKLRIFESEFEKFWNKMFYLPIRVKFLNQDTENFNKQILSYVSINKRDRTIYKREDKL